MDNPQAHVPHIELGGHHGISDVRCKVRRPFRDAARTDEQTEGFRVVASDYDSLLICSDLDNPMRFTP